MTRSSDGFDFHNVSVWQLKAALLEAYALGLEHSANTADNFLESP
jgi:hypothetical protein